MRYDWFKQLSINQFESVLRFSQISIRIRIRIQLLVIVYYEVMLYISWCLWNSVMFHNIFSNFFFRIGIRIRIPLAKSITKVMLCVLKITTKFGVVPQSHLCSRWGSGSGSWFYFGFQYQIYISYIEDTHQILFGSANSFEIYCAHMKSPRTYGQTNRRTDWRTDGNFFWMFCLLRHTKHEHSS